MVEDWMDGWRWLVVVVGVRESQAADYSLGGLTSDHDSSL